MLSRINASASERVLTKSKSAMQSIREETFGLDARVLYDAVKYWLTLRRRFSALPMYITFPSESFMIYTPLVVGKRLTFSERVCLPSESIRKTRAV